MDSGWEQLAAPYFKAVCARIMQPYFEGRGFQHQPDTSLPTVLYVKGDTFLEVSYWVEDAPRYVIQGAVGLIRPGRALNGRFRLDGVGLWRFDPTAASREFSSEQQLEAALINLRDHLLEPIIRPVWEDRPRLEDMVGKYRPVINDTAEPKSRG